MGRKMRSYTELGGSTTKWLDAWKKKGLIKVWLHPDPGWERRIHSFRRVDISDGKDGPTKSIKWLPFVCMEDDEYHIARSKQGKEGRSPVPKICPACRLIRAIEQADEIKGDEVVFEMVAGKRERRAMEKDDLIGIGERRDSYQDSLVGKSEYLIYVIEDDDPSQVKITNEGYGLMKNLKQRIEKDIQMLGEDEGDPSRTPICYTFEFDSGPPPRYGVSRFPEAKLTPEIRELWNGEPPDAEGFATPGDPNPFYKAVVDSLVDGLEKVIDVDEVFGPALDWWDAKKEGKEEDASFDPDRLEGKKSSTSERSSRREDSDTRFRRSSRDDEERPRRTRESEPEERSRRSRDDEERPRRTREPEKEPEERPRRTRESEKEPEAESNGKRPMGEEMGAELIDCPACGSEWEITSHSECPSCGFKRAKVPGYQEKEPEAPRGERSRTRRF